MKAALKKLKAAEKKKGTSLIEQNDNKSMVDLYQTDAPELSK